MDDATNSGSFVFNRRKLNEVPLELFKAPVHKPVRAVDLGYNLLKSKAIAALGDEELDPHEVAKQEAAKKAVYNPAAANKPFQGAAAKSKLKGAALAVQTLVGSFNRTTSAESTAGGFSRISSAGSTWELSGIVPKPKLKYLEVLVLTHNNLVTIPDELSNCRTLKQLWLNANIIVDLPASISVLDKLEILSCNHNFICTVRKEIGCCTALTQLLLRSNKLGMAEDNSAIVLPEHVGLLTNLKVLEVAYIHICMYIHV